MSSPLISQNEVEAKSSDVSSVQKDRLKYVLHIIISVHISVTKPFCFSWLWKILDPRKCLTALLSSSWSSDLGAGLEIPWSRFQVPLLLPAGFVPGTPAGSTAWLRMYKATRSTSCDLGFLICWVSLSCLETRGHCGTIFDTTHNEAVELSHFQS